MTMWRRLLNNINNNFEQALAGASIIAIGASLLFDRNYFFWPPEWTLFMNDKRLDLVILCLGLLIIIDSMFEKKHRGWRMFLLIVGMWTMWFLIAIQLAHAIGAGEFRMAHTVIGDAVISILCYRCICQS